MRNKLIIFITILVALNIVILPREKEEEDYNTINYPNTFNVTLNGEVSYPGVYLFHEPVSLEEVVTFAGGFTNNADKSVFDLTEVIFKTKTINVKREFKNDDIYKYDLNKVSYDELRLINNVSDKIALNIIIYRETNGSFKSVNELLEVKYIGEKTFEKIYSYFKV